MDWIVPNLWLVPSIPLLAAGLTALAKQRQRKLASTLAIGSVALAFLLSCVAFACALQHSGQGQVSRRGFNFPWLQFGDAWLKLGWTLDPLSAVMLVMVSLVSLLIFIYSLGYMAEDDNFVRFFCFLSLFAAAMLGLVIANSFLLLFICWELVGLTSYLLIGFWYHKPSAAAAAKKALIVTRIGDLALLLGMVWLYSQTGTLLFYDAGQGCLEQSALAHLVTQTTSLGMGASTAIALLVFCGAIGKSGQLPLHVWLPDAMEGPTPVSALIHAATMVAAGVFLVARVYPLMAAPFSGPAPDTTPLRVIAWVGALTALFAATIAVAQTDIKRILAYSTVSQLGFMMLGLGVGGVAVGMFHLLTHAFFKALLFMGAGSVIHGCHQEQDIRRMGGLRKYMPVTFATYAIGMMALCGVPIFFSGFWSKEAILHAARFWGVSRAPFYLAVTAALLTAFYMTRQVCYVFWGQSRAGVSPAPNLALPRLRAEPPAEPSAQRCGSSPEPPALISRESPGLMTVPLIILAAFSVLLGFIGTPAWPWFQAFLNGHRAELGSGAVLNPAALTLMLLSTVVVLAGLGLGWWLYGRNPAARAEDADALERLWPNLFALWQRKYFVDEAYECTFVGFHAWWSKTCDWLDRRIWGGAVQVLSYLVIGLSRLNRLCDDYLISFGFDEACRHLTRGGSLLSRLQNGRVQSYLRLIGIGMLVLVLFLIWGCRGS